MNKMTFDKLQLNEFKEIVKVHCVSSLGKDLIDKLDPSKNLNVVKRRLNENKEAKNVLSNSNHIPLEGLFNIYPI
jgi:dsDNA-specific endonuclease/ATPase MutS2